MSAETVAIRIPLFPLPLVVFPGEVLPLHIFEERYREMLAFCLETEPPRIFGIVLAEERNLLTVGCTVRIDRVVNRYENGSLDVLTVGHERFEVEQITKVRAFAEAMVRFTPDLPMSEPLKRRERAIALHGKLIELVKGKPPTYHLADDALASYYLGHDSGLGLRERQGLLELRTEQERIDYLIEHLTRVIPVALEKEEIQRLVKANGYFRKFASPL